MIDAFCIFELGGTVLWRRSYVPLKGDPLAMFVRSVLLEDRLSLHEFCYQSYSMLWTLDNQSAVVFVVLFQSKLRPAYAQELLQLVRRQFVQSVRYVSPGASRTQRVDTSVDYSSFGKVFEDLSRVAERRAKQESNKRASTVARRKSSDSCNGSATHESRSHASQPSHAHTNDTVSSEETKGTTKRAAMIRRLQSASHRSSKSKAKSSKAEAATACTKTTRSKKMRPSTKSKQEDLSALDFSEPAAANDCEENNAQVEEFRERYLPSNIDYDNVQTSLGEDDDDDEDDQQQHERGVFSYFKALAGMRSMTRSELQPVMNQFREFLIAKNVAQDVADKLMESVLNSLTGKRMDTMTSMSTTVRKAVDEALTRILTTRQGTDIVAEISAKRSSKTPYVITFCGVNGVGKSTSLAKTCYFLLRQGFKVMIAACDTFRAGAVEQLRTHVKCLGEGVQLFDKGYGKDAASVAADAIRRAKELQYDVVLVDTAGRMQDNEPLMRALAKLVQVNRPDRVLFVGEALVGNDAVDQLSKFNRALMDFQTGADARVIDGIVLTKFDTIDDKVGAAVSMVYATGQPIVFVGVGQTYTDLRKVNTRALVRALLR
eukprot:TRINITY_DN141_c0_g1_i1.p1 TRINITY_DN141_c0_g1~~TRINITY_DN141_c0_g1_i1.p1  ORF type:complete len:602 (+),score=123.47 TRINITY_DN141_c0_g1_i1:9849-11654(+)